MYKIVICDDQKQFYFEIARIIELYSSKQKLDVSTEYYNSGVELIKHSCDYDLLFLDIDIYIGEAINTTS